VEGSEDPRSRQSVAGVRPRPERWLALAVFGLALALRLGHVAEIRSLPTFYDPIVDGRSYHEWAERITEGDRIGNDVFYQAPAYPYFLALTYAVGEPNLLAARIAQSWIGAAACALLVLAGARLFGAAAGAAAGGLLAIHAPAVFFDGLIQKASLAAFLLCTFLWCLAAFRTRPTPWRALGAGVVLALLALTRENALVLAGVILPWMVLRFPSLTTIRRAVYACVFALALLLPLLGVGLRNHRVGGTFALTTSQLGPNLYIGNNPEATGMYRPLVAGHETPRYEAEDARRLAEAALGRPLTRGQVSAYWRDRALEFVAQEPLRWLGLVVYKALLTINQFEVPDAEDLYLHADHSRVLRVLNHGPGLPMLLGLATVGFLLGRRRNLPVRLPLALAATFAASVVLFYVFARYRYPFVLCLLPLAGLGITEGWRVLRQWAPGRLLGPATAAILVAALSSASVVKEAPLRATSYFNLAEHLRAKGQMTDSERYLQRAEAIFPDSPRLQVRLAVVRLERGKVARAERHARRALELAPNDRDAHLVLAAVLERQGHTGPAMRHRARARRLGEMPPASPLRP